MTDRERARRKVRYEDARKAYDALMKFYPLTLDDLGGEEWRNISGYEGLYQESNYGRTKSFKYKTPRILRPALSKNGYLVVALCANGKGKLFRVNRLVAEVFIPNPESKLTANHRDGHKLNNFVDNLEWATHTENTQHAYDLGLHGSGENNPRAKLTHEQVIYIRENHNGLTNVQLATMFGVSEATIIGAQCGRKYRNAGGTIRQSRPQQYTPKVPDELRKRIRTEYVYGSNEFGSRALARKYNLSSTTILNIVNEK